MMNNNAINNGGNLGGPPNATSGSKLPTLTIGGKKIDISRYQRTFFCIGPVCLRSGIGFGAGVGCGAGIGKGFPVFKLDTVPGSRGGGGGGGDGGSGFTLPTGIMNQIPGGYQVLNVLKGVLKKWPGSRAGAGCGVGVGYGVGVGLQYGAAGGGFGRGLGGRMGGGGGSGGGSGGEGSYGGGVVGGGGKGGKVGGIGKEVDEKIMGLEKRIGELEDKLGMQLKMKELEERIGYMEKKRRR